MKVASLVCLFMSVLLLCGAFRGVSASSSVNVRLVTDEADAVLAILAKRKANQTIADADWQRVFQSEGYVRLKQREASMQRSFEDADFKTFALSDQLLARAAALEETLGRWKRADVTQAGNLALAYLPPDATIRAKIYPVIKPRENSFVFDVKEDPAIFLYLDPAVSAAKFENTLAHELHHIGYGSTCPRPDVAKAIEKLPQNQQSLFTWIAGFGEGFAMLAAAGGPNVHPHAVSKVEERARWDKDVGNFNEDLQKVDAFFTDVLQGKLTEEQTRTRGFSFFGVQGPWYTVGWRMAALIENTYGRAKLIECMCDQRLLLPTYNRAAAKFNRTSKKPLALWSAQVVSLTDTARNSWKGIVPLRSTRADVKRILGTSSKDVLSSEYFELRDALVEITYQMEPCNEGVNALGFGWNVPKDTVTAVGFIPKRKVSLRTLLTQGDFKITFQNGGFVHYTDATNGLTIETYQGAVSRLGYDPGKPDAALQCPKVQSCCVDFFHKFDEYEAISFADEKARLDNWSLQLTNTNSRGLLIIRARNPDARRQQIQRAERAKNYLVRQRGFAPERLLIVDGGYSNVPLTELHLYGIGGLFSDVFLYPEKDPL